MRAYRMCDEMCRTAHAKRVSHRVGDMEPACKEECLGSSKAARGGRLGRRLCGQSEAGSGP